MDFKFQDIALIVVAIAAPTIFLILAFTPGGLSFIGEIAMNPLYMPWIFFGGAAVLFGVLSWRIYRRIRPAPKKPREEATPHVTPTPKFSLRRPEGGKPEDRS